MKEIIEYDDFAKLDMRAGTIVSCEKVENAEKLYKIMVDVGEENPRQIVSSLVDYYTAEELVGKRIIVLVNLKPRDRIAGHAFVQRKRRRCNLRSFKAGKRRRTGNAGYINGLIGRNRLGSLNKFGFRYI